MGSKDQTQKLSFKEKCAYGLGDISLNFFWALILFSGIFYTDYFGISATAAGTMMLIVRLFDIGFDLLIGAWADRAKKSKYGRFRPWILYGAPVFAVCAFFTYYTPNISDPAKLVYAYVTFTLFMLMYSVVSIPYGALLGVISPNANERTEASAYRNIFALLGCFFVYGFTFPIVGQLSKIYTPQMSFAIVTLGYAIIGFVLLMVCFYSTKERIEPIKKEKNKLSEDFRDLLKNRPWIFLTIASIMLLAFLFIHNGMIVYYAKYYVATFIVEKNQFEISGKVFGFNISWEVFIAILSTIGSVIAIIGTIIIKPLVPKFGKKNTWIACFVLASICSAAFYIVPKESLFTIMLLQTLFTLLIGPTGFIMWSMYADVADYAEVKTGRRATGLIYSSATIAQKLGSSISGAISLLILGAIGFVSDQKMSEHTQEIFIQIFAFLPILASVIAIIALSFYNIDETKNSAKLAAIKAEKKITL